MPLIKIDDKEFEVKKGITVLQAALTNEIEIPHYCYHPVLEVVGSCRMCLVQVEGMPKLQHQSFYHNGDDVDHRMPSYTPPDSSATRIKITTTAAQKFWFLGM